ncbi:conserved hypothetical protein [Methanolacinia petrolearia DSM 11571]|uniref:ABC-2 type transport system permease protein n=1 Tax=Methanolacinia petrolearia (strain DSM 11571 / OCM 486 / SEBR 4847) TaxID=679926 RepID=E1RJ60_METP4|nr:hypothetical protein [Methanolacinia petrolearia]ADN36730.1 conserved hypothetical protein [Methanolacinia petrolearia DSM 11571]
MLTLFANMFREEWRMHSTLFGSLNFALFPVLIFAIAFMGTFILPLISNVMDIMLLSITVHAQFVLLGIMVGSFGIMGKEVMNRRFGQGSLIAYSARSLPVSERIVFLNFVVKDIVYYFILWVLPFGLGFLVASPFNGIGIQYPLLLLLTMSLGFLFGLCTIFLLSAIYSRSKTALFAVLAAIIIAFLAAGTMYPPETILSALILPVLLFNSFTISGLVFTICIIAILFALSIAFFTPADTGSEKHYRNILDSFSQRLGFLKENTLVAKDFIDLYRSGIGVGQIIFSFILPLGLIWLVLSFLTGFITQDNILFTIAVVTGIIASTMYTWLTEFDSISVYHFLPLNISSVIRAKVGTFTVLQAIPVIFLVAVGLLSGDPESIPNAVVLCLSISFFELALMIRMCGLQPGAMIYNVKVFLTYILVTGPVILVLLGLTFVSTYLAYFSVILFIPAWLLIKSGFRKWDSADYAGF